MRITAILFGATVIASACGGGASTTASPTASPAPSAAVGDSSLGKILVGGTNKMTLYTFANDKEGTSTCYDACATAWPPYTITGEPVAGAGITGKLATVARKDGLKQLTWNTKPLYFYNKDTKPGDVIGQNVGTIWFVVTNP